MSNAWLLVHHSALWLWFFWIRPLLRRVSKRAVTAVFPIEGYLKSHSLKWMCARSGLKREEWQSNTRFFDRISCAVSKSFEQKVVATAILGLVEIIKEGNLGKYVTKKSFRNYSLSLKGQNLP